MTFLYGDSSDSGLELNYIELFKEILGTSVQILSSEGRIVEGNQKVLATKIKTELELAALKKLNDALKLCLETESKDASPRVIACAQKIKGGAKSHFESEIAILRAELASVEASYLAQKKAERVKNLARLQPLLVERQMPGLKRNLQLVIKGDQYKASYLARCKVPLEWVAAMAIPKASVLSAPLRLQSLRAELNIELPETSGFVRKSVKLKTHKLSVLFLTRLQEKEGKLFVELRASANVDDDTGLNILLPSGRSTAFVVRLSKGEKSPKFEVRDEDLKDVLSLCAELQDHAHALVGESDSITDLHFSGKDLKTLDEPSLVVKALVALVAPIISKIATHSLSDTELVLKRVLDNGRREEIYASVSELRSKAMQVPTALRHFFSPLGILLDTDSKGANNKDTPPSASPKGEPAISIEMSAEMPPLNERAPSLLEEETTNVAAEVEVIEDDDREPTIVIAPQAKQASNKEALPVSPPKPPTETRAKRSSENSANTGHTEDVSLDSIDVALAELEADT